MLAVTVLSPVSKVKVDLNNWEKWIEKHRIANWLELKTTWIRSCNVLVNTGV